MNKSDENELEARRWRMVREQIEERGVTDPDVLTAMRAVPRHEFMPVAMVDEAYDDAAFPIGEGQTISQPYIVGLMTSLIEPEPGMRVLEIGTGSGYQAAVLARCVGEVYTIEIHSALSQSAAKTFAALGITNVRTRVGDGHDGWPDAAPFDAIMVTAACPTIPAPLVDQLAEGGRLVAPVGRDAQDLIVMRKHKGTLVKQRVAPVMFVPMTGKVQGAGE